MEVIANRSELARQMVRQKFGEAFEKKASDEVCLALLTATGSASGFRESLPAGGHGSHMVLEFSDEPVKQLYAQKESLPPVVPMPDVFKETPDLAVHLETQLKMASQNQRLRLHREAVLKSVQEVNTALEKKTERAFSRDTRSVEDQRFLTQTCWLNQAVRTIAPTNALAELADHPGILRVDLTRKLRREINATGVLVGAPAFRKKFSMGGKNISVGVIDGEILLKHAGIDGRVVQSKNYTKEPWGYPDPHATGIAGIIGSADAVYSGMAPEVQLYNYKVFATDENLDGDDFDGSLAIQDALEQGVKIVNLSWGTGAVTVTDSREARACNTAWQYGLLIVKSSGNNGPGSRTLTSPAEADGIIVVGACDKKGTTVESYSSRGPLQSGAERPHLLAPGGGQDDPILSCLTNGTYGPIGAGTSFATPHVSGLLALLLEQNPASTNNELRDQVIKLCTQINGISAQDQGAGLLTLKSL